MEDTDSHLGETIQPTIPKPFGEANRRKLIQEFFETEGPPTLANAWKKVYRLLLWIDSTTGLAHCYESDKCQPGRPWYGRSLAFHDWLSDQFNTSPIELGRQLDWMFQHALQPYLTGVAIARDRSLIVGEAQRADFSRPFPIPGGDPEVERIIHAELARFLLECPPSATYERISANLREYWKQENKRKNLLGEGFEDVLAAIVNGVSNNRFIARTRVSIATVAGFSGLGARDKATKVDLVIEGTSRQRPLLVNVKWSSRADREDQLWDDFKEYVRFDRDQRGFDHYIVTNEFDPARLNAMCERREFNNYIFRSVVHINTAAVLAAYRPPARAGRQTRDTSISRVRENARNGRLISLSEWLTAISDG